MRTALLLATSALALAQIPADPYELVSSAKPADRIQSLALLNRAKKPMRFHMATTLPHLLSASFTADSGPGELTELWLGAQDSRWTAKLGDVSISRINVKSGAFDEKPVALVPMRVHMLRNAIFWAGQGLTAASTFRTASVEYNGRPTTCLLVSDQPTAAESSTRRWDETEYCIDDQTSLLQILSLAPGNYTVYSYAAGLTFHGQPLPDLIKIFVHGAVVIDASLQETDPGPTDTIAPPTTEMLAAAPPVGLEEPTHQRIDVKSPTVATALVNAQIGPDGSVVAQELCTATDPSIASRALDKVKSFPFGNTRVQRQAYIEVRFAPVAPIATTATPAISTVQIEPYYLERSASFPGRPTATKEIVARRSDGATVRVSTIDLPGSSQTTRELNFPDGRRISVYDSIKAKVTWPKTPRFETSTCALGRTVLRHEQYEGVDVDVTEQTAGSYRVTMWAAPKLGCENVYMKSETVKVDGTFQPAMETKTTKLAIGEPDPLLFDVPLDLAEMKPSEAQRRLFESLSSSLPAEMKAALFRQIDRDGAEADKRYEAKRP